MPRPPVRRLWTSGNAAILARKTGTRQRHTAQHLWPGPGCNRHSSVGLEARRKRTCRMMWLYCGDPRLDRSVQGSCLRLPGGSVVSSRPPRRRCSRSRQFRDTVDIVPPLSGNVERVYSPMKGMSQEEICPHSLFALRRGLALPSPRPGGRGGSLRREAPARRGGWVPPDTAPHCQLRAPAQC
jgi:hypothetical protein